MKQVLKLITVIFFAISCGTKDCWQFDQELHDKYFNFCMKTFQGATDTGQDTVSYCDERANYHANIDTCK